MEVAAKFAYRNGGPIGIPRGGNMDCAMVAAAPVLPVGYVVSASRIADRCVMLTGYCVRPGDVCQTCLTLLTRLQHRHCLNRHDSERADDGPTVLLPKGRLPELDDAAGRKTCFADTPAPQLAPVIDRRQTFNSFCWDARRNFAAQDSQCNASRLDTDVLVRQRPTADNAQA
jgi:hypothetical protein